MLTRRRLIITVVVVFVFASSIAAIARFVKPNPSRFNAIDIAEMKERFAYRSLKDRLSYEKRLCGASTPPLAIEAQAALDLIDKPPERGTEMPANWSYKIYGDPRVASIRLLHRDTVRQFIARDGFGYNRMPAPGPDYLVESPLVSWSFEQASALSREKDEQQSLAITSNASAALESYKLPQKFELLSFHAESQQRFADYSTFGDVLSVERVAGFEAHRFVMFPRSPIDRAAWPEIETEPWKDDGSRRWLLLRVELVSLLKHDTPAVYLSEHLPKMDELSSERTRPLSAFEADSLDQLRAGEELIASADMNVITMIGAIRAANDCMICHDVPHGTLLGAFSYQLQRDPPIRVSATND